MKRVTVIGVLLLLVIGMLAMPSSALTWETYLEEIEVTSGTTDINTTINFTGGTGNGTGLTWSIKLPCNVSNLDTKGFVNISCNVTFAMHFNLSINGVYIENETVNETGFYNLTSDAGFTPNGKIYNITWDMSENLTGAGHLDDRWLNFTYNSTNGHMNITVEIYAHDVILSSTWLTDKVTVEEMILATPEIDDEQAHSYFPVKDKIKVTNDIGYKLWEILLNLTYPSQAITHPESSRNLTLANGTVNYYNISYSKYGPYVFGKPVEDIDEDEHEVKIKVQSHEVLARVVDWSFYPTAEDYEDYFVTIDYDTLEIRLNNVKIDWEEGSIEMEEMSLIDGISTFEFTWTEAEVPVVPPVPGPWDWLYEDYGTGIALWMWFVITAIVICVIAVVAYAVRKK